MTSRVGIAMVVLAVVSLLVSSGGVSSVTLERSIEVAVADEKADQLVAFSVEPSGENSSTINVTNRGNSELTVTEASADGSPVELSDKSVGPGSNASIEVTHAPCPEGDVPVEISVETESRTIETTVDACSE